MTATRPTAASPTTADAAIPSPTAAGDRPFVAGDPAGAALAARIDALDWQQVAGELDQSGCARLPALLDGDQCAAMAALYDEPAHFRSRVVMARHGFGRGEYQYFGYPLPAAVQQLRESFYDRLLPLANRWRRAMGGAQPFPASHAGFIEQCRIAGQPRPTPLLLRYQAGDFNCLHQDLYGDQVFPLQLAVLLSQPGQDFEGGEFVMTEQRPRQQSRVQVVPLMRGDAVVFAVSQRPVAGSRGTYRVNLRHGVSRLRAGHRLTLGVILHDAA